MAKRKHSTALFEVITRSPQYSKPLIGARPKPIVSGPASPGLIAVAVEWFKHRTPAQPVGEVRPPAVASPKAVIPVEAPPVIAPVMSASMESSEPPAALAELYTSEESGQDEGDLYAQPVAMAVDPENRQIAVRMSYSAAFIVAASVVLVVGVSLVIGQHLSRGGMPLLAQTTTAELLKKPAHPEVLEPTRRSIPAGHGPIESTIVSPGPATTNDNRGIGDSHPVAPPAAVDGKRYIGLNYIIAQSYPLAEEKMAKEAAAFLNKEGVSCTIETGVKGYLPITVVGLQGFEKQSSPACKAHMLRITQISAKYTSNSRSYKAFAPVAKKWDKQD